MQDLVLNLLDMARLEMGTDTKKEAVEINALLQEIYDEFLAQAEAKEQKMNLTLPETPLFVTGDRTRLQQVARNLLGNAIKYTPMGGKIGFGGEEDEHSVTIWVKDNGPGIPASEHERIFDKFSRLNLREAPKGLGLGLAYCRLAIQSHGGRIWVESEPGAGARFVFNLPTVKKEED